MTTLVCLSERKAAARPSCQGQISELYIIPCSICIWLYLDTTFARHEGSRVKIVMSDTPQQNELSERKNMTLIEAARTMLVDSFLPTFWAKAVVLLSNYIRPFGCHVTILNTIDHLGKFDGKSDEGFLVGYSLQSKAFRVYNLETKRVEENLHITFLENKPNVAGKGPTWLFDLDYLTDSMNYQPVRSENQANKHAGPKEANHSVGTEDNINAGNSKIEAESAQDYFVLPIWSSYTSTVKSSKAKNAGEEPNKNPDLKTDEKPVDKEDQVFLDELERLKRQEQDANDAAKALRKEFAKDTEDLLLQAGAAKASRRTTSIQDSKSLDSYRFALWEEGNWNKIEILKMFDFASVKTTSTPIETHKPLVKDEEASDVDVTSKDLPSKCFVKRIFRYLKGKPKLGLWYPRVSSFDLKAYSDSDYARANLNRKSTTGGSNLGIYYWDDQSTKLISKGRQYDLLYSLSEVFSVQKNLNHISTTFVEQFWMSAKSKLINNVRYITAKVAGKPVYISKASIRSDLLFNDDDGIDSLPNHAIFDAIQLMRPLPTTHILDSIPEGSGGNHGGYRSSQRN
ncbi:retrovirus-related pol polyprotein from transposon TNT 1-94 [Tanacetum coccineum]